ncbi:MAG: TROVE domain-containing protein, partial [Gammaproteobacteria bacterium]|nr:TROVE domain-containing protein [Gammaproteobacteria bacterium]
MAQYLRQNYGTRATPQSEPIPDKDMVQNSAGGYTFSVGDWGRLTRFLILGSEGNTYYTSERDLTKQNVDAALRCIREDGERVVREVVAVSEAGRAPKNDPALYILAMCASKGELAVRRSALTALPQVARTGTYLLHFVSYCKAFRGWGRALRTAIGKWYTEKPAEQMAYQVAKYQSRDRWAQRDLLRLAHPVPPTETHKAVFHWVTQGWDSVPTEPPIDEATKLIWALETAKTATGKTRLALIRDYGLTHEMIPTEWKKDAEVWEALLEHMPMTAMIRNLATITRVGLLKPLSVAVSKVVKELNDV